MVKIRMPHYAELCVLAHRGGLAAGVGDRPLGRLLLCSVAANLGLAKMKFLLLMALFFVVWWLLRKVLAARASAHQSPARAPEQMVKCAHCGVNQPVSESILTHGHYYCCNEHRLEAESRDG